MGISARALRAGRAIIELSLLTGPVEKGLRSLQTKVATISKSFSRLGAFGGIGGGGLAGLRNLFVGSAATAALAWPVKLAANIEVAAAQLGVFVGGVDRARQMLMELQEFSAISMVDFESLSRTAALLVRYGQSADDATRNTEALAVLAAGDADEFDKLALAFAQVGSAGRLQGEEMRQFKNTAFNPLREIAQRTGETMDQVKQRMEAGGISFNEVANSLRAAVGPAGRFNGLLEAISNTLLGQVRKAWAQFKMAVLPLGNELLAPLTKFFRAINGVLPAFTNFVKAHSGSAKTILATLAAIAAGAVVFTAMGLSINLVTIAAGGMATVFSIVVATLGAILSPAGLVIGLLGILAYKFFTASESGRAMVNNLANYFVGLKAIATAALKGIADALMAGNIILAADILMAGLKLAFLEGTNSIATIWRDFANIGVKTLVDMLFDMRKQWQDYVSFVELIYEKDSVKRRKAGEEIGYLLTRSSDPDTAREQYAAHAQAMSNIERQASARQAQIKGERGAALAAIDEERRQAQAFQDQRNSEAVDAAKRDLREAKDKLSALTKQAHDEAINTPEGKQWFGAEQFKTDIMSGFQKAKHATKPIGTFDTRLARQMFGKGSDAELEELKKIEKNTRKAGRLAGIRVV